MHPGNRIGIPTIVPFARRKSQSNIPSQSRNRQGLSSDLLQLRLNYLQGCFNAFDEFQNTKNVDVLKEFVINNTITLRQMVDQIYMLKELAEGENKDVNAAFEKQFQKLTKQNQTLKRQLQIEKKKQQKNRQQYQQQTTGARGQQQIALLQQTIFKLKKQGQEFTRRNEGLASNLGRKNFFKEFEKMHRECEGLHRQNDKLKEIIRLKKQQLQTLRLQGR